MVRGIPREANSLRLNMNHMLGYTVWLWGVEIIPVIDSMWASHRYLRKKVQGCSLTPGASHMVKVFFFF